MFLEISCLHYVDDDGGSYGNNRLSGTIAEREEEGLFCESIFGSNFRPCNLPRKQMMSMKNMRAVSMSILSVGGH